MTNVPPHPAEFSPEVVAVFAGLIRPGEHVHDPYAGRGLRLGVLCDLLGVTFTATDCEAYDGADSRVARGDSANADTYPPAPFTIICSPPYLNGISSDYKDGPTPNTKLKGRRSYGTSLGRPLAPENLARLVVRSRAEHPEFWAAFAEHVVWWDERVILNVDKPMHADAVVMLQAAGYVIDAVHEVSTPRYRNGANADIRPDHEVVICGWRP